MPRGPATTLHVGKGPDVETPVDVVTQITVDRPVDAVASYAGDPSNATKAVRQHRIGHVADVATNHGWLKARVHLHVGAGGYRAHTDDVQNHGEA